MEPDSHHLADRAGVPDRRGHGRRPARRSLPPAGHHRSHDHGELRGLAGCHPVQTHHAPGGPPGLHFDSEKVLASFLGIDTRAAQWLKEQHTDPNEFGLVCLHQPSVPFVRTFRERLGIQPDAVVPTFHRTGNMGAATLPLQLAHAADQGRLRPGTQVVLFGMASGGVMLISW